MSSRLITLSGTSNVRDLAGYKTDDKKQLSSKNL